MGSNPKTDKVSRKAPDGLNTALYKVFERYSAGNKTMGKIPGYLNCKTG
jgi:hypothetical protein